MRWQGHAPGFGFAHERPEGIEHLLASGGKPVSDISLRVMMPELTKLPGLMRTFSTHLRASGRRAGLEMYVRRDWHRNWRRDEGVAGYGGEL